MGTAVGFALLMVFTRWLSSRCTGSIGLVDGRLRPCPDKPNCVSSQAIGIHAIEPIRFQGSPESAWKCLIDLLRRLPRLRIMTQTDSYLHVEARTRLFGFVDDVEFLLGGDVIHVRSASRLGYSDLGVNRRRVEAIRREFHRHCHEALSDRKS